MGRLTTSTRYVIDITRTDPLSLLELVGGPNLVIRKMTKNEVFLLTNG